MEFKFDLGDQVRVKNTDNVGTVKRINVDVHTLNGKRTEVVKYCVQIGTSFNSDYYQPHHLEHYNSYDFDDTFEIGLVDMLIDIYLLQKKLDLVSQLHIEKQQYL
jgi:hypothetical protein